VHAVKRVSQSRPIIVIHLDYLNKIKEERGEPELRTGEVADLAIADKTSTKLNITIEPSGRKKSAKGTY